MCPEVPWITPCTAASRSSTSCPSVGLPPHNPCGRLATLFTGVFVVITTWQRRFGLIGSSRRRLRVMQHYSRQNWGGLADLHSPNVYATLFRDVSVALPTSACIITYLLTYLLTPWSRVLLEKLTGFQLVKKFPAFQETQRLITAFTRAVPCPYPVPTRFSPCPHIQVPEEPS